MSIFLRLSKVRLDIRLLGGARHTPEADVVVLVDERETAPVRNAQTLGEVVAPGTAAHHAAASALSILWIRL